MPAFVCLSCSGTVTSTINNKDQDITITKYICGECDKVMFPVPPVCTAGWGAKAWYDYIQREGVDKEPLTITSFGSEKQWVRTDKRNENGEALYTKEL